MCSTDNYTAVFILQHSGRLGSVPLECSYKKWALCVLSDVLERIPYTAGVLGYIPEYSEGIPVDT